MYMSVINLQLKALLIQKYSPVSVARVFAGRKYEILPVVYYLYD